MFQRIMILCILTVSLLAPGFVFAQEASESRDVRATVVQVDTRTDEGGVPQATFEAKGEDGKTYRVDTAESYQEGLRYKLKPGTRVILQVFVDADGGERAYLADVVRTRGLVWMAIIFAFLTVLVGWWRGLSALAGLGLTLGILFGFVFPRILAGGDPVVTSALGCVVILAVNMHLSHGFSKRTLAAFGSTVIGLGLAAVFAKLFVGLAHLSGLGSEEAVYLYWQAEQVKLPTGILLAGILIGATGVLDDIAITQSETVAELREANPALTQKELFSRAMRVGRHHIASTVNTLVLAYAGVALPLFLLFLSQESLSVSSFLNAEPIAEEFVRTIAGTCALILTVPVATLVAAWLPETR